MVSVTLFNDGWYHKIIDQTRRGFSDDTSADATAIATGLMIAGCCIAQALDHLADGDSRDGGSIRSAIQELAGAAVDIAEKTVE